MSDLPHAVRVTEEGPREGFQIEKGPIATARKIALIDALSQTGLDHIQVVSFVNPKAVPGMADADDVVRGIAPRKGVWIVPLLASRSENCNARSKPFLSFRRPKNSRCAIKTAARRSN